jgi:hypothetical protein
VYSILDQEIPNWKEINVSEGFLNGLNSVDVFSGAMKNVLLRQAFNSSDASRVLAFFNGYLAEHPEARKGASRSWRSSSSSRGVDDQTN